MRRFLVGTLVVLFVALAAAALFVWQRQRSWYAESAQTTQQLLSGMQTAQPNAYLEQELIDLPAPVVRYFKRALRDGQPMIRRARITWAGEFNMGKPGADSWKPFKATQTFVVNKAGFVWDARIAMAPGVPVLVRDSFVAGSGTMQGRIAGAFSVADRINTPGIATAALQRYLGEAIWFPTALLPSQGVRWTAIDATRARATLTASGVTASVEFHFNADGTVAHVFVADRFFDNGKDSPAPTPWRARNTSWRELNNVLLPAHAVAEWLLPAQTIERTSGRISDRTGEVYAYWRGGPVRIVYD